MKRLIGGLVWGFVVLGMISAQSIAPQSPIRVGLQTGSYLPYYSDEGGEYRGILIELMKGFAQASGLSLDIQILPTKRMIQYMVDGVIDMQIPDHPLWGAKDKESVILLYSDNVVELSVSGLFVVDAGAATVQSDRIQTVGVPRGFTATALLSHIASGRLGLVELPDSRSVLLGLLSKRIDSVYGDQRALQAALEGIRPGAKLVLVDAFPTNKNFHYRASFSDQNTELRDRFNRFLRSSVALVIYDQWGLNP